MNSKLLAAMSVAGALAVLAAAGHTWHGAAYAPIADAGLASAPRIIEPLVDRPDVPYGYHNPFGYDSSRHNPDGSITLTYLDRTEEQAGGLCVWPFCGTGPAATGKTHVQTYRPNSTFAYYCSSFEDYTLVYLYQYLGTSSFRGNPSLVLAHFEVKAPGSVPCEFPDYLVHTVDIYDAAELGRYDLEPYAGPPEGADDYYLTYVEPVMHAVPITPLYADEYPPGWLGEDSPQEGWMDVIVHNPDGSITVTYRDLQERLPAPGIPEECTTYPPTDRGLYECVPPEGVEPVSWPEWDRDLAHAPGTDYVRTYVPGQTFLAGCLEGEDSTRLIIYNYRGSEIRERDGGDVEVLIFANFKAYTRAPMPCTYPDALEGTADAFGAAGIDAWLGR